MNMQNIMRSLPLIAGVLGQKYGVKVEVGGSSAYTDGETIHLPSLPAEATDIQLNLVRSYLDHESAHIRHTDFEVLKQKNITPLKKHIWNILEDWRVENELAKRYPGCRQNFNWLIHHTFAKKKYKIDPDPGIQIVNYILLSVRAWDVAAVESNKALVGDSLAKQYLNLLWDINTVLNDAKTHCLSSADCLAYTEEIVKVIENHAKCQEPSKKESNGQATTISSEADTDGESEPNGIPENILEELLSYGESMLPSDMGEDVAKQLKDISSKKTAMIVATESMSQANHLSPSSLSEIQQASNALSSRLQGLLQSRKLKRSMPGRSGKLDPHRLNKVWYSSKVFLRHEENQGLNTHVHILLDCSGSMQGKRIKLASQACYTVAKALSRIDGVKKSVTAFPAKSNGNLPGVFPLLKPNQGMHTMFELTASGGTPLGESLWYVLQQDCMRLESRKLILILSDGEPDLATSVVASIKQGKQLGFEFYGLGIQHGALKQYLPDEYEVINDLNELVPAMFNLLQGKLLQI
ncbi:VWA domain-containing protein [Lentisphaera marina]|uniref:cobaltochelatase CobT-related protein n=1 Tax=Lentisphaera marina TaxID=1111041 RepID=UPI002366DAA9|nr:VWA domain-containing protein [Lentisphaera marina]MDD7984376.1 VWA domain-containing protein [Lentisphaera marina]